MSHFSVYPYIDFRKVRTSKHDFTINTKPKRTAKEVTRDELNEQIEAYLAAGGEIKDCGSFGTDKMVLPVGDTERLIK